MTRKSWKIRWVGPNSPIIISNVDNRELRLSKQELSDLAEECNEFISWYRSEFTEDRIHYKDDVGDE